MKRIFEMLRFLPYSAFLPMMMMMLVLAGCSAGLNESFQAAYGLNEVTRRVATELNDSEKISIDQAEDALEFTDEARQQLDAAWVARETAQDSTLSVVRRVTGALQSYLNNIMVEDRSDER